MRMEVRDEVEFVRNFDLRAKMAAALGTKTQHNRSKLQKYLPRQAPRIQSQKLTRATFYDLLIVRYWEESSMGMIRVNFP